jgi:bromodomain adjacent to zinc finger domain protein 1A
MPLLKRKPVIYQPLPSLSTILQPIASSSKETDSTPPPPPSLTSTSTSTGTKTKKSKPGKGDKDQESELGEGDKAWIPPDADNDHDQLRLLSRVFEDGFTNGSVSKGKKAGTWIVNGSVNLQDGVQEEVAVKNEEESTNSAPNGEDVKVEWAGGGEMLPPPIPVSTESWKITDREVYYVPESGEIFTDYE